MTRPRQLADTPSLTATVPRQLVHRAALAETFLTGWRRTGADRFTVSAQWPRAHGLHVSPDWSAYDPLLVVETIRQSGTLVSHTEYEVPLDQQFVLKEFHVTTEPWALTLGPRPAEPEVELVFTDVQYRGRRPVGARYTARVVRDGTLVAAADVSFSCVSEPVYQRLRGGRTPDTVTAVPLPPGVPADAVDRALPTDVVLAPTDRPDRWQLRVNTAHPVFFDHPLDHVPGMLLLEGARQAALLETPGKRVPTAYHAVFHRYAELDVPTWIEAKAAHDGDVQVVGVQGESTVFACLVGTAGP
ncbi:A-factor biosynthesis protein [Streptomyces phaeoluteigriseus]|uniref:A-factor biosynthesis protein n=1 Tax=Streptomyces phaeoluteigriseus TaxID=114686 RepID=A0ABY4Z4W3_9ACTN|nr:ScbA/BarX family gamma-butyrolactone biosynthesis protein [Streptomyces phaeoluteigriseus]USQ84082.1 A-factor biosynthesis protein [Streptomyces phaeoluteigriseus]